MRYVLVIKFIEKVLLENIPYWVTKFKTKREALTYKDIIDHTVRFAYIEDTTTGVRTHLKGKNEDYI